MCASYQRFGVFFVLSIASLYREFYRRFHLSCTYYYYVDNTGYWCSIREGWNRVLRTIAVGAYRRLSISLLICYEFRCFTLISCELLRERVYRRPTVMSSFTVVSSFHQFSVSQNRSLLIFIRILLAACVWTDSARALIMLIEHELWLLSSSVLNRMCLHPPGLPEED